MGCNPSKLDRLPAVALCRERCKFLDEALRQSYALADAHVAHMESLKTIGHALHCFFHQVEDSGEAHHPADPPTTNSDDVINDHKSHLSKSSPSHSSSSSSISDPESLTLLHSESEAEDTDKELQFFRYDYLNHDTVSSVPDNAAFTNYAQPLFAPFSPPPPDSGGYGGSKPPSPPPPSSSAWDFLNFFEAYEKYEVPYIPSQETKKGRIRSHHSGTAKKDDSVGEGGSNGGGGKVSEAENEAKNNEADSRENSLDSEKKPPKSEECSSSSSNSAKVKSPKSLSEAVKEIQILFERASDSGNPILEMLDVGKLRYHKKIAFNRVSCKMMHVFIPSIPSKPLLANECMESSMLGRRMGSRYHGVDKDKGINNGNLCSTLRKLSMWEKKLYHEVKAEEKLRILHEKKCRQLRRMKKKGADEHKVDSVQTFVGILATKMKVSIQVVDKISNTTSKMREEELWPQINRLILMLLGMWKEMLECYRCQYKEIAEAKTLDASSFNRKLSDAHIDAATKLKSEIQNWNLSFSDWIHAQKSLVKALNGWLVRCLLYEPVPHGAAPFSPGRIGAPPVFVICNKWSKSVDYLSEKDVIEAANGFMLTVNVLLEKLILDLQHNVTLDKELERKVKVSEKVVQVRERKMAPITIEETGALLPGDAVHHGELVDTISLQSGLGQIFAAMERLSATTARAYEELCRQIKQVDNVPGESNIC